LRPLPQVPEDRVRLGEGPAVVEDERGHAESRVETAQQLGSSRTIDHGHVDRLVRHAEMGEEEPHLVAVARDGRVVEQHAGNGSRVGEASVSYPTRKPPRAAVCRTCFDSATVRARQPKVTFTRVGDEEAAVLAAWLAEETWPFHARNRWTPDAALDAICSGDFSGTNPTYWVELAGDGRVGIVH